MSARPSYTATIPEEPPVGTVVLDSAGVAWQRLDMSEGYPSWKAAVLDRHQLFNDNSIKHWPLLLMTSGPLTELYRPESEDPHSDEG